jgi:hypothetical protein
MRADMLELALLLGVDEVLVGGMESWPIEH